MPYVQGLGFCRVQTYLQIDRVTGQVNMAILRCWELSHIYLFILFLFVGLFIYFLYLFIYFIYRVSHELRSLLRESVPMLKYTDTTPNTYVQS